MMIMHLSPWSECVSFSMFNLRYIPLHLTISYKCKVSILQENWHKVLILYWGFSLEQMLKQKVPCLFFVLFFSKAKNNICVFGVFLEESTSVVMLDIHISNKQLKPVFFAPQTVNTILHESFLCFKQSTSVFLISLPIYFSITGQCKELQDVIMKTLSCVQDTSFIITQQMTKQKLSHVFL